MQRAILIDAANREIKYVPCQGYLDMRKHLPGGITVCWVFHDQGGDVLYVDDEALLRPAVCAFRWKLRPDSQPMMSNGLLTGRDNATIDNDGDLVEETFDPLLTPEQVAQYVEWLTVDDALSWFRSKADEPAGYVTDGRTRIVTSHYSHWLRNLTAKP